MDPTRINLQTNVKKDKDPTLVRMTGVTAHGYKEFDVPFMTEIAPNLWQGGCQTGLQLPHFIKHLVSLYKWEQYQVKHDLESSFTVTMYDSLAQATDEIEAIAKWVNIARKSGPVLVHCQAGLNRSSLVVATALFLNGDVKDGREAIERIRSKRSDACLCNPTFEEYVSYLGEDWTP